MKRLIIRLSSLGDLILSQSVLEPPFGGETHWVVAKEFSPLLVGNPKVSKVWSFDRKTAGGMRNWISLLGGLRREGFDEVLDIHSTLRTRIARLYFRLLSPKTRWRRISKERFRRIGYELLKRSWPQSLRPTHFARRCALLAGGYGNERPNLRWLIAAGEISGKGARPRVAVVPSSAWVGKEWPVERYLEWVKRHLRDRPGDEVLLLGTSRDHAALALRDRLVQESVPFVDGVGKFDLPGLAQVLAASNVVVGSDTGLLHLAESVGTPVITIFGPTRPDFGFGPLDERSKPVASVLWCSPCSKDGSLCFRPVRRYECLHRIEVKTVEAAVKSVAPSSSLLMNSPPPTAGRET